MSDTEAHSDDYKKMMGQKRFLNDIEQGIRVSNQEIIHKRIPEITKDTVLAFAISIANLRARYLEAALNVAQKNQHGDAPDQAEIQSLRTHREMYEEAKLAFEALRYAIERGYVDCEEPTD